MPENSSQKDISQNFSIYDHVPLFKNYNIEKYLGSGSSSDVYLIKSTETNELNAVKVITIPDYQTSKIKIFNKTELLSSYYKNLLNNTLDNINYYKSICENCNYFLNYSDIETFENTKSFGYNVFVKMEYAKTLREHIDQTSDIMIKDVIKIGIDLLSAVEFLESREIVFKYINESCIFISKDGYIKIGSTSFLNENFDSTDSISKTQDEENFYLAPEAFWNNANFDSTVDIYSIGVLLYKILNYDRFPYLPKHPKPIEQDSLDIAFEKKLHGEKLKLPSRAQNQLGEICVKACSFNSSERYKNASEMKKQLESLYITLSFGELNEIIGNFMSLLDSDSEKDCIYWMESTKEDTIIGYEKYLNSLTQTKKYAKNAQDRINYLRKLSKIDKSRKSNLFLKNYDYLEQLEIENKKLQQRDNAKFNRNKQIILSVFSGLCIFVFIGFIYTSNISNKNALNIAQTSNSIPSNPLNTPLNMFILDNNSTQTKTPTTIMQVPTATSSHVEVKSTPKIQPATITKKPSIIEPHAPSTPIETIKPPIPTQTIAPTATKAPPTIVETPTTAPSTTSSVSPTPTDTKITLIDPTNTPTVTTSSTLEPTPTTSFSETITSPNKTPENSPRFAQSIPSDVITSNITSILFNSITLT